VSGGAADRHRADLTAGGDEGNQSVGEHLEDKNPPEPSREQARTKNLSPEKSLRTKNLPSDKKLRAENQLSHEHLRDKNWPSGEKLRNDKLPAGEQLLSISPPMSPPTFRQCCGFGFYITAVFLVLFRVAGAEF